MAASPSITQLGGLALCFDGRAVSLQTDIAPARPARGDVLFRPSLAMIDDRDRAAAAPKSEFRGVLGHRAVGTLEGGPAGLFVPSPHIACAVCDLCRAGLSAHCRLRRTIGLAGRDGVLSEAVSLPSASLRPLPAGLSPETALFALDAARAMHVARRAAVASRTYVSVIGDGPLALVMAQVLSRANARVRLLGRAPGRDELCERWGVKHRPAADAGLRGDQDLVVICSGSAPDLELAAALVRPRGVIALTPPGGTLSGPASALSACVRQEVTLLPVDWGDVDEGLSVLASGEIDTTRLVSDRQALAHAPQAFARLSGPGSLATLIDMSAPVRAA